MPGTILENIDFFTKPKMLNFGTLSWTWPYALPDINKFYFIEGFILFMEL